MKAASADSTRLHTRKRAPTDKARKQRGDGVAAKTGDKSRPYRCRETQRAEYCGLNRAPRGRIRRVTALQKPSHIRAHMGPMPARKSARIENSYSFQGMSKALLLLTAIKPRPLYCNSYRRDFMAVHRKKSPFAEKFFGLAVLVRMIERMILTELFEVYV